MAEQRSGGRRILRKEINYLHSVLLGSSVSHRYLCKTGRSGSQILLNGSKDFINHADRADALRTWFTCGPRTQQRQWLVCSSRMHEEPKLQYFQPE